MKLNRRNTLIGLGTVVAGGGAALGTGAFSTVEADRTVDVDTAGDDEALLGLSIDNDTLEGGSDRIEFDVEDLNENAKTTFQDAFVIEYNGEENPNDGEEKPTFSIEIQDEDGNDLVDSENSAMCFGSSEGSNNLSHNKELEFDVVFDLRDDNGVDDVPDSITIIAERNGETPGQ